MRHAELSPDGKHVLLLLGNADRVRQRHWSVWFGDHTPSLEAGVDPVVHLWDLERKTMTQLVGHDNDVAAAHFSADGRHIVSAGLEGNAKLWDVVGGAGAVKVLDTGNDSISIARFSPDGRWVATARGRLELPLAALLPFIEHSPQRQPDVRTVRLWDAVTGKQAQALVGHTGLKDQGWRERLLGDVVGLAFSPDGKRLLVWSHDKTGKMPGPNGKQLPAPFTPIRFWDHAAGREAIALEGLTQQPQQVAVQPRWPAAADRRDQPEAQHRRCPAGRQVRVGRRGGT